MIERKRNLQGADQTSYLIHHPVQTTKASEKSWETAMGRDAKDPAIHLANLKDFHSY